MSAVRTSPGGGRRGRRRAGAPPEGTPAARLRILEGAAEAFGRLGYAGTRVEDVLAAAGVSRPTFYKSFESKDHVFDELAGNVALSLVQAIRTAVAPDGEPEEKLERGIEAFLRWQVATGPLCRVMLGEARNPRSPIAPHRDATLAAITEILIQELPEPDRLTIDPLVYVGLAAALEAVGTALLDVPRPGERDIRRHREVMERIVAATLSEGDPPPPPLPRTGEPPER